MLARIVCVGNRLVSCDDLGPRVFDELSRRELPEGVEAVDGGLRGLDLLTCVEQSDRVVFVDAVAGFAQPGDVVELRGEEAYHAASQRFDHAAGLGYLLQVLPAVCEGPPPEWILLGGEQPGGASIVEALAERAVELATSNAERFRRTA